MTITLISQSEYDTLLSIQKNHPILTFQNNGFEYIDKSKFTDSDWDAYKEVDKILRKCVKGFSKFFNFKLNKKGEIKVRFDYHWDASFTGVGYLYLDELLNGFRDKENVKIIE